MTCPKCNGLFNKNFYFSVGRGGGGGAIYVEFN